MSRLMVLEDFPNFFASFAVVIGSLLVSSSMTSKGSDS